MSASNHPDLRFPKKVNCRADDAARTKPCAYCGVLIRPRKPSAVASVKCCSKKCEALLRRSQHPLRSQPCVICGRTREGHVFSNQKTCSAKCGYEYRKRRTYGRQHICVHCGADYWPHGRRNRQKFCSARCYFAHQASQPAFVEVGCAQCGAKFRRTRGAVKRVQRTFCSRTCTNAFLRGENSPHFRGDKDPNRGAAWNTLADSIRQRDSYRCRRCSKTQEENGQKLSVDHVVPWRVFADKNEANDPTNLASLCRSCHSKKTGIYERLWLKGDVIGMEQYRRAINLQPLFPSAEANS